MNTVVRAIALCVVASLVLGCGASRGPPASGGAAAVTETTPAELRALAMSAADSYATAIAQASDQLRASTTQPAIADWAWQTKITTTLASFTNATGPDDALCLLDMVLFATLKRQALEEHWIPNLLHEEGKPVLEVYRRAEADVWAAAGKSMTRAQQDELRTLIDRWRREHPGQYYVSHVRFAEVAAELGFGADSPRAKAPGSIFGLLHVDPLAGLDPVTAELRNYRALSERMIYMSVRMPLVLGWQVEYAAIRATGTPEVHRLLEAWDRFLALAEKLPADVSKERTAALEQVRGLVKAEREAALAQVQGVVKAEREAAVDQVNQRIDGQRQAITDELTKQTSQVRQIVGDVSGLVGTVEQAAAKVNESTSKTIVTTEEAGRRTMTAGFWYALVLILVLIIGPPTALLLYRLASKRWVSPSASPSPSTPRDAAGPTRAS